MRKSSSDLKIKEFHYIMKKTNPRTIQLIRNLKKLSREQKAPIWRAVADTLGKPAQRWAAVNIGELARHTKESETVLVPGKLLGSGVLSHPLNVYSFSATESAKKFVKGAKGNYGRIEDLMQKNPKGSSVRLMR